MRIMGARVRRAEPAHNMRRVLSLRDLLFLASASMAPAFSLATTLGPIVAAAGGATPAILVAIALLMACIAGGYRLLGRRHPNAGSSYTWVGHAFGPTAGAYAAWTLLVANVFAVLATALPAATYTLDLLAPRLAGDARMTALIAVVWILAASGLLVVGLRPTAFVAAGLLVAEFVVLGATSLLAALREPVAHAATASAIPAASGGLTASIASLAAALAVGVWLADGWEVSASTAEEAHGTSDTPGNGGFAGLIVTMVLLVVCSAAYLRLGTVDAFVAHTNDALAFVGSSLGGGWSLALAITVLVSIASTLQTTLVYLSRSVYAMGRDGLLPAALGKLDRRDEPVTAVATIAALGVAGAVATAVSPSAKAAFDVILGATSVFIGLLFLQSSAAAVATFRTSRGADRFWGFTLPLVGCLVLAPVLAIAALKPDGPSRTFIIAAALAGLPFAIVAGRRLHRIQTG